ncbi:hypothetical protein CDAR_562511 [Caerostris darwini]|uniref:Uncharacterized protein n=1 Tax=Caerostris darwini TaxID=1538125 RepID=A0AAV4X5U8_9ARAC|nr:hypothetical protein CDAR_562511 [Caerostris darwini]
MEQRGCSRRKKKGIERFSGEGRGWSSEEIGVICISGPTPRCGSVGRAGEEVSPQGFWACLQSSVAAGDDDETLFNAFPTREKKGNM